MFTFAVIENFVDLKFDLSVERSFLVFSPSVSPASFFFVVNHFHCG